MIEISDACDVEAAIDKFAARGVRAQATMLDPWYNKGVGGVRDDYFDYITGLLEEVAPFSDHIYLWGFPEIIAHFITRIPSSHKLTAWLTWYYKNNPSVIRGWRSAQMTCLHMSTPTAKMYPQHFLNEAQLEKQREGKLRYMPGPPSVIEAALNIGFVGRKEQTGHPAQKPIAVYKPLIEMVTVEGDLVFDPMCGSGTTGVCCKQLGRRAVISDMESKYVTIARQRVEVAEPIKAPIKNAELMLPMQMPKVSTRKTTTAKNGAAKPTATKGRKPSPAKAARPL